MQEPDEQGYLMHLWHGNARAEQLNATVRLEFPIRIRRRSGKLPLRWNGEMKIYSEPFEYLMIKAHSSWWISEERKMGDSIKVVPSILGYHWLRISKDNNAMMKGIFPPENHIGRVRATAPPWWAYDKAAGDEHTLPQWNCLINEWPKGLTKRVQKALRLNWTAIR